MEFGSQRRALIWKGLSVLAGVTLSGVVIVTLSIGSCHSQGGFCSGDFDQANKDAFYSALVASLGVGPFLVAPFTRKVRWLIAAAAVGLALTTALVLSLWP